MNRFSRQGLMALMLASAVAPLSAQEIKEAFRLLPPTTLSVEVFRDAAVLEQRTAKIAARFIPTGKGKAITILPGLNLDLAKLAKGYTVVADFPHPKPKAKRQACLIPVTNFPRLVKSLKAVKASGRYAFTQDGTNFAMAQRGAYAVISTDPELLKELKGTGANLAGELTPLLPWIASHDAVILAPSHTVKQSLLDMRSGLTHNAENPPKPKAKAAIFEPLIAMAEASVTQGALAVDFPEDGSVRAHARLFLKPGSPLASTAGDPLRSSLHPMAGLPAQGFVMGGAWSKSGPLLQAWTEQLTEFGAKALAPGAVPDKAAKAAVLRRALASQIQSQSMSLGVPAKAGDPVFAQFRTLTRVEDAASYLNTWMESVENQIQGKLLPAGIETTLAKEVLPGVPSASQTLTFSSLKSLPLPPGQLKMILSVLFGQTDRITFSMAQVDPHTLVGVLGGAPELQAALAPAALTLDQDPGIKASDLLLPTQASFRFYLAVDGVRAIAQQLMDSFVPGAAQRQLPALPAAPPLAMALHADAQGLELSGVASSATLDAMGTFFLGLAQFSPQKPEAGPASKP